MLYQQVNSVGKYTFECRRYHDFNFIPHIHKHLELTYVREGSIVITSEKSSEELHAGEFALVLSNRVHAYNSPNGSVVDVCVFSEDNVPTFGKYVHDKMALGMRFSCSDTVRNFIESVLFSNGECDSVYLRKSALYAVVSQYLEQISFAEGKTDDSDFLLQVLYYISCHYRENITLESTAKALGYDPHYLSGYFHRKIHVTFSTYVNQCRIDAACDLLKDFSLSITEIAMRSGFQSIRTFNRVFQTTRGETPSKWRNNRSNL